jgi:hypothetical protein
MPGPSTPSRAAHLDTVAADTPLATRLPRGLLYPLRGAALATLSAMTLGHLVAWLLPSFAGWGVGVVVWVSTYMYALECLRHTADGYAQPPEIALYAGNAAGIALYVLQMAGLVAIVLATRLGPDAWVVWLLLALVLPAVTMALAFEDGILAALNPVTLASAIGSFGAAYLLPIAGGVLQTFAYIQALRHGDSLLQTCLWYAVVTYLVLFNFHLMGMLMLRYHVRIGHLPESLAMAQATGSDIEAGQMQAMQALVESGRSDVAIDLLAQRLQERGATPAMHHQYRHLLRTAGRREALLAHAPSYIAVLLLEDDTRRALGVTQECIDLDPQFLPGDATVVGELADAAARTGMSRLALKLARAYPNTWPRDPAAPRYGLLAARLLAAQPDRRAEAGVLASKLLRAYPDGAERDDLAALLQQLGGTSPHPALPGQKPA